MAKKQTRRSISVRGTTYVRLRDFCERQLVSMSEFIEDRIAEYLAEHKDAAPAPAPVGKGQPRVLPTVSTVAARPQPRPALRVSEPATQKNARSLDMVREAARRLENQRIATVVPVAARPVEVRPAPAPAPVRVEAPRPAPVRVEAPRPAPPTVVVPPRSVEAARPIRVATPPPPIARSAGRPAPTPADKNLKIKNVEGGDGTDYRAIRF